MRSVYRALLSNTQVPVLPDIQRRIVEFAQASSDTALIVSLLARPDVDAALERELSLSNDLEVLAAWASDPRRTSEDLRERLEGEKRVNALLPLARRRGLPVDVYEALGARRSVRIAEALAENMSVPDSVRLECLRFLVARPTWYTSSTPHWLARCIRNEDDARAVAESAVHMAHLRAAVDSPHFSASLADVAADRLKELFEASREDYAHSWSSYPLVYVLSALRKFALSDVARQRCLEAVELVSDTPAYRGQSGWNGRGTNIDRLREAFDPSIEGFDAFLRRLADPSSDVSEVAAKVFAAAADDSERRLALDALTSRRNVPDDLLKTHFGREASLNAVGALFSNLLEEGRVELLAELSGSIHSIDGGTVALVQRHPSGHDLVLMVAESCREVEVALPGWVREMLRHDRFADLALEVAQWPELSDLLSRSLGQQSVLSMRVQELLVAEFGDDPERWRVFSELGSSFAGSLRMLVQTVKTLS